MATLSAVFIVILASSSALVLLRLWDARANRLEWHRLASRQPASLRYFDTAMVAQLPEPARRYFAYVMTAGAPILPVTEIEMRGRFSLGDKRQPRYQAIEARQVLAAPHGFLWKMQTRQGLPIAGSDSGRWTRFWLLGCIPVARLGGDSDHARSAFGRYIGESTIWSPAALLPGPGISWDAVSPDTARVTVTRGNLSQSVEVKIDEDGRPRQVSFLRWSNANTDRTYRLQPFGAIMSDFREVEGYRLPYRVEAGNLFGTDDYFPFFIAEVTAIAFPRGAGNFRDRSEHGRG
jgi:hypothetical protein